MFPFCRYVKGLIKSLAICITFSISWFCVVYRTKEQLGYVVDCSPRVTYRILGFCFRVQSSEFNPVYLQGRIDSFINGLKELLVSSQFLSLSFFFFFIYFFIIWFGSRLANYWASPICCAKDYKFYIFYKKV